MRARLFCKMGEFRGASFEIQGDARIGKAGGNEIRLESPVISGKHARIYYDSESRRYFIEDLGSRNGTQVDGSAVTGKEPLDGLHVITFAGMHDFFFQIVSDAEPKREAARVEAPPAVAAPTPVRSPTPAPEPTIDPDATIVESAPGVKAPTPDAMATVYESPGAAPLDVREQPAAGGVSDLAAEWTRPDGGKRSVPLKPGMNVVGRALQCEICIDDASISREHAIVSLEGGTVRVKDLGSMNGTTVAGKKLTGEVGVTPGTEVIFGMVAVRLVRRTSKRDGGAP